jgi:hypothetical protein
MRRSWPTGGCCPEKKYFRKAVELYYATVLHNFAAPYWSILVKIVVEKE